MPPARVVLWVASLAAVAVLVRTVLSGPPPVWVAVALLGVYVAIGVVGVFFPRLEMYGDAICCGRAGGRRVALTFDDGPDPVSTPAILAMLEPGGHRATFFLVGSKVLLHPEVVEQIVAAGHSIGVHGHVHRWGYGFLPPSAVARDIQAAQDAVERACGKRPELFRPPIGIVSPRTAAGARRAKVPIVLWSVKGGDGVPVRAGTVVRRVRRGLRDGAIVLLHDAAESGPRTPASLEALPPILQQIETLGLATVGVEEFVPSGTQL